MRPFLVAARLKERKGLILLFGTSNTRLEERKGRFLHFGTSKVMLKEQKGRILLFGCKSGSATIDETFFI